MISESKRKYNRKYYLRNRKKLRAAAARYRRRFRKKLNSRRKELRYKNYAKALRWERAYRKKNRSKINRWHRNMYKRKSKVIKKRRAIYRRKNPSKIRRQNRSWRLKNRFTIRERYRQIVRRHKYDLAPRGVKGRLMSQEEYSKKMYYKNGRARLCSYCSCEISKSSGGLDRIDNGITYTVKNTIPACRGCNSWRNEFHTVQETRNHFKPMRDAAKAKRKQL